MGPSPMSLVSTLEELYSTADLDAVELPLPGGRTALFLEMSGVERDRYDTYMQQKIRRQPGLNNMTFDNDKVASVLLCLCIAKEVGPKEDGVEVRVAVCDENGAVTESRPAKLTRIMPTDEPLALFAPKAGEVQKRLPGTVIRKLYRRLLKLNKLRPQDEKEIEGN